MRPGSFQEKVSFSLEEISTIDKVFTELGTSFDREMVDELYGRCSSVCAPAQRWRMNGSRRPVRLQILFAFSELEHPLLVEDNARAGNDILPECISQVKDGSRQDLPLIMR